MSQWKGASFRKITKSGQAGTESSKIGPNLSQGISLDFLRRIEPFQGLAPTPRAENSCWPLSPGKFSVQACRPAGRRPTASVKRALSSAASTGKTAPHAFQNVLVLLNLSKEFCHLCLRQFRPWAPQEVSARWFAPVVRRSFFIFASGLRPFEGGEGLAPFYGRGRSGALVSDWRPRGSWGEPEEARVHGTLRSHGAEEKTRPIDPMSGKNTSASKKRPIRLEPLHKRTGASPSCPKSVSRPLPLTLVPSVCLLMRMRPLFVGRVECAFHPAINHH
jgi:hypothetical protein